VKLFTEKTMRVLALMLNNGLVNYKDLKRAYLVNSKVTYYILMSHLKDLGLIKKKRDKWELTKRGKEFAEASKVLLEVYDRYYGE